MLVVRRAFRSILQMQNPSNISRHLSESSSIFNSGCEHQKFTLTGLQSFRCIYHNQQFKVNTKFLGHRTFCSEATNVDEQESKDVNEKADSPREVYRFYKITLARSLNRLKFYQTAFAAVTLPYLGMMNAGGHLPSAHMMSVLVLIVTSTSLLYVASNLSQKLVCILNYDEASKTVHIAHLTFWGKRRDVSIPLTNIIPFSDSNARQDESFLKIETYDNSESFLLFIGNSPKNVKDDIMNLLG